jgi:hypothetical protein
VFVSLSYVWVGVRWCVSACIHASARVERERARARARERERERERERKRESERARERARESLLDRVVQKKKKGMREYADSDIIVCAPTSAYRHM